MFILNGVWKRKEVQHPDELRYEAVELASLHPYNIVWDPDLAARYVKLYGQADFDVLKESAKTGSYNMVESYEKAWVQGGTFVAADPIPEPTLGPDEEWVITPFGKTKRKKTGGASPTSPAVGMTAQELEALIDRVVMSCLRRAGLIQVP